MSMATSSERESQTRMMSLSNIGRGNRRASSRALTRSSIHFTGVFYFGQTAPFRSAAFYDPVCLSYVDYRLPCRFSSLLVLYAAKLPLDELCLWNMQNSCRCYSKATSGQPSRIRSRGGGLSRPISERPISGRPILLRISWFALDPIRPFMLQARIPGMP